MNEAAIKERIIELTELLTGGAPAGTADVAGPEGLYIPQAAAVKKASVDVCVDHLRLQLKYLLFDLEATKRENGYLRQMLQARPDSDRRTDHE